MTRVFISAIAVAGLISGCAGGDTIDSSSTAPVEKKTEQVSAPVSAQEGTWTTSTGLKIEDIKVGFGAVAVKGKNVKVHYTGRLEDGKQFDSSHTRNQPFEFPLGGGRVIRGWDEGVAGMKVGGKRILTIPSHLGYGAAGVGGGLIPPNATLIFDVELLEVR